MYLLWYTQIVRGIIIFWILCDWTLISVFWNKNHKDLYEIINSVIIGALHMV